jgi:hypothetical protein
VWSPRRGGQSPLRWSDDYDIVVVGIAHILEQRPGRAGPPARARHVPNRARRESRYDPIRRLPTRSRWNRAHHRRPRTPRHRPQRRPRCHTDTQGRLTRGRRPAPSASQQSCGEGVETQNDQGDVGDPGPPHVAEFLHVNDSVLRSRLLALQSVVRSRSRPVVGTLDRGDAMLV